MFYVYVHKIKTGPKAGQVFYVGKGSGYRCNSKRRNFLWKRVAEKYGYYVEIVENFERGENALRAEARLVEKLLSEGAYLTNLTSGGENCTFHESSRKKISQALRSKRIYEFSHREHGDIKCTQHYLINKYELKQGNVSLLVGGKRMSCNGWTMKGGKLGKPTHGKKYKFSHYEHGDFYGTQAEIMKEYGLHHQSISDVVRGKSRSHRGWCLSGGSPGPEKNRKHRFVHDDGTKVEKTQAEMVKEFDLSQGHLSSVIIGKRKKHKGWSVMKEKPWE